MSRAGAKSVKFGLFGGARTSKTAPTGETGGMSGDSLNLNEYISYVLLAEELGFSNIFMVEHHFTGGGQVSCLIGLLTYLAARTTRIRLGTAVIVLPWHNPALLAESVATLDLLSGGRFDFGVGKGYKRQEFDCFAMAPEEAADRFEETLGFLRKALSSRERFSHQGKFWTFRDVVIEPEPVQTPHPPIWLGGGHPDALRRAATIADGWMGSGGSSNAEFARSVPIMRQNLEKAGRDPKKFPISKRVFLSVHERADVARAECNHWFTTVYHNPNGADASGVHGTPEQVRARLEELVAHGADHLLLNPVCRHAEQLEALAAIVGLS